MVMRAMRAARSTSTTTSRSTMTSTTTEVADGSECGLDDRSEDSQQRTTRQLRAARPLRLRRRDARHLPVPRSTVDPARWQSARASRRSSSCASRGSSSTGGPAIRRADAWKPSRYSARGGSASGGACPTSSGQHGRHRPAARAHERERTELDEMSARASSAQQRVDALPELAELNDAIARAKANTEAKGAELSGTPLDSCAARCAHCATRWANAARGACVTAAGGAARRSLFAISFRPRGRLPRRPSTTFLDVAAQRSRPSA